MMKEVMRAMENIGSLSSLGLIFCIAGFLAGSIAILSVRRRDIERIAALPIEKDTSDE
jgi:hypothetical protein